LGGVRYVVAVIEELGDLTTRIVEAVVEFSGVAGLAKVRPAVVRIYRKKRIAIVRIEREGLPLFRASLAAYPRPILRIIKVTGTLRRAQRIAESLSLPGEVRDQG